MNLRNAKVFITGATGFIGGSLSSTLVSRCAEVRVLVRNYLDVAPAVQQGLVPIFGDVTSINSLKEGIKGCDIVCHLVAGGGSYQEAREVNVEGTKNVLDAALFTGIQKIVALSSVGAYGSKLPGFVDESYPITEKIHYEVLSLPISPLMAEEDVVNIVEAVNRFEP